MGIFEILMIGIGLSMDAAAVSMSNGMCIPSIRWKHALATAFAFGAFQGIMPLIGYFAGSLFAEQIGAVDHWLALVLLGFIGGKMIYESLTADHDSCPVDRRLTFKLLLVQAIATSIDALAVGVSFAALDVNIAAAASFIACVTFVCCLAGHLLGKKFGSWLGGKAEIFGGVILVCIGAKILVEHLSGG